MPVNTILLDGVVERLALRFGDDGRPELRWIVKRTKDEPDATPKTRAPRRANQSRWGAGPSGV
jgi:hypothetical protein